MRTDDLPAVLCVAAVVHPLYPEEEAVFAERLRLYPAGSRVLIGAADALVGYVVSHPWSYGAIPALDSLLGALPPAADAYYIHDIALLPAARGQGAAQAAIASLADHAAHVGFAALAIVAIAGTQAFWEKQGFRAAETASLTAKLASYDPSARYMVRALG
jgi:GNAT superfamily N-acetyltransferase